MAVVLAARAGHLDEGLLYVGGVLSTSLQEGDVQAVSELLGETGVNRLLDDQIAFVTDQQLLDG